uniref:Uncharacterized protein n=1 Tax=Vibrio cholerae serotype O1 biovar El Tor TaxID=686 RepID=M1QWM0_VIBCE|nr:hypothetical protein [Vibrio cholerae O1 biovar El Tor]
MTAQTFNFEYDEYNRLLLPLQYHDITCAFVDALGFRVEDLVGQSNQVRMSLISLIPPQTIVEIKQLVELHHDYFKRWLTEENKCIFNDILHNFIKAYTTTTRLIPPLQLKQARMEVAFLGKLSMRKLSN